ncbi:hypothetical protein DDB_G0287449 [Dictyostelium discoideum AX4]|uniref:FZ domain-containing protein n=1 Tax=Dictyostelium discoideum TaxID=44689 RepID=Q54KF9_DICDI|nr:hypothetical protein DDB_G0287449 [Dictyostelium discoideum AX4]EAL63792.1 hypothetical protein DDB_G0287449 [Dictyostelium discoideum AX4]|eukprot:XP_637264.1 hypothetical protein DDB_G0287449 [Dictyostelium discoideum AX4]
MVLNFQLISVLILFIYFFKDINGSILSSSSSSSSSSVDYYPIESSGRCDDYIGDTTQSDCSIYLPYKRIYISDTFNQTKSLEMADRLFPLIQSMSRCNQPSVFKTLCSYLFPECQLYTNNKVVVAVPVLTCYEECTQSVSLCNGKGYFNCNQTLSSSESVPRFPVDSYYYNFEEYQSGILDLKCRNTFKEDSDSNSNNNSNNNNNNSSSNSDNVTPMPTETSSEEHNYNNSHRSLVFKIFITLCITVPIILIIALIWYNFKRRATKLKKLQEQQYQQQQQQQQQQYLTINTDNEQTPLLN